MHVQTEFLLFSAATDLWVRQQKVSSMRAWSKFIIAVAAAAVALVPPAFAKNSSFDQRARKMERYNARAQFSPARRRLDGSAPALGEPFTIEQKRRFQEPTGHEVDGW
jgi:hypothetical protein